MLIFAPIRRRMFCISPDETKFARRGFARGEPRVQQHLETAGAAFVEGYNAAVATPRADELVATLNEIESMYRGFAFEGAAMALAMFDWITPWDRSRFERYLQTPCGDSHLYMLYVGVGWGMARIPWARKNFECGMQRYDPLYRWLAVDGFGFHQGFFHYREHVTDEHVPRGLSLHAARVFDQGLGRSMWFSQCADPRRIAATIGKFSAARHADLWSGLALAASYAGGVDRSVLENLAEAARPFSANLAQGAAFAAKARQRAGNLVPHTKVACDVFCGTSAEEAAAVTDRCLKTLPPDGVEPAYQAWRARISASFSLAGRANHTTMATSKAT
jgi:enediyne biosynthesis protein E3